MAKFFSALVVLAMAVQIVKPLGWPGLRRRSDFWKIALAALAVLALDVALREASGL